MNATERRCVTNGIRVRVAKRVLRSQLASVDCKRRVYRAAASRIDSDPYPVVEQICDLLDDWEREMDTVDALACREGAD